MVFGHCLSKSRHQHSRYGALDRRSRVLRTHHGSITLGATCWHHERLGSVSAGTAVGSDATAGNRDWKPPRLRQATAPRSKVALGPERNRSAIVLKVRRGCPRKVNPADVATKYLLASRMRVLLVFLSLKLVAHHDTDARFWCSERVSCQKLFPRICRPDHHDGIPLRRWEEKKYPTKRQIATATAKKHSIFAQRQRIQQ